jgi:ATP-dependent Clp protease ATP-binding subunit ClpC
VVAMMTGIPVNRVAQTESEKLLKMGESLKLEIVGQDEAVSKLTKAIRRTRAGLKNPNRPIGSFIFLGPTGVGKTELCKALARYLFDSENALIRIDMSEYMEKFSLSRLVGAPPGYVGYEEGGQLTEKVRRKPYSVVLFDEIEKAHPDIFSILLQVLDDGTLTDSLGRKVDFRNTIIIMTSNIGARDIKNIGSFGFGSEKAEDKYSSLKNTVEDAMRKLFNPEFLNRVDETIVFRNLDKEDILKIIDIELKDLLKNIKDNKMKFELDITAKNFLVEKGFDEKYGARPLRRAIQKYVEDPIAEEILKGTFKEGSGIVAKHYPPSEELDFVDETPAEVTDEEKEKTDSADGS